MNEFEAAKDYYNGQVDLKAAFTGTCPGDIPLLEELGINLHSVKVECTLPFKIFSTSLESLEIASDIAGSIIMIFLFAISLLLQGKLHFGYVYLVSIMASFFIFLLLNFMSISEIKYLTCCNIIGYSLSPVVIFSFLNILLRFTALPVSIMLGALMATWSAYTASKVFCYQLKFSDKQLVVFYPLFMIYSCFILMAVF